MEDLYEGIYVANLEQNQNLLNSKLYLILYWKSSII